MRERAEREGVEPVDVRFTRREVREYTGWGHTQIRVHLGRLEDLEYVVRRSAQGGGRRVLYSYDGNLAGSDRDLAGDRQATGGGLLRARIANADAHLSRPGGDSPGGTSRDAIFRNRTRTHSPATRGG